MISRRASLRFAKQVRTCPPAGILEDPSHKEALEAHFNVCPYCTEASPKGKDPFEALAQSLRRAVETAPDLSSDEPAAPGQIRQVREELGRWRDRLYYNPPVVLVLETVPEIPGAVTAAQIFHDPLMAGPGDLILTEADLPLGPLFIEPWNTYTLSEDSLGPVIGRVPVHILRAVETMARDDTAYPEWAQRPVPMAGQDARITFRSMEVEVGYTFSAPDVEGLMNRIERPDLRLIYSSPSEIQDDMKMRVPGIFWPRTPPSLQTALATARFPLEALPMAADESGEEKVFANLVRVRGGRIESVTPVPVVIFERGMEGPGVFTLDGRVRQLEGETRDSLFLCYLSLSGGFTIESGEVEWDPESGSFIARFSSETPMEGRFSASVVCFT
ncbi:MAG: hypothetical protein ABII06_21860 [Pseudomonadota bacterium]